MDKIATKYHDKLPEIQQRVQDCITYNAENVKRYNKYFSFIFNTTVTTEDRDTLATNNMPVVEFNVLESYLSRLCGEFSKQVPEVSVKAQNESVSAEQVKVVESHIRSIFSGSDFENIGYDVYREIMAGGFSVFKVFTEYEHDESMRQVIRISKAYDPTLCGFDPLARASGKHDGQYCYELVPKYKSELEKEYPDLDIEEIRAKNLNVEGFKWTYKQDNKDVFYVCDYYEKQYSYITMCEVSDPTNPDMTHTITKKQYQEMIDSWDSIMEPPVILKEARRKKQKIIRYKFIDGMLIERPEEIDYDYFPLIFVDGNSAYINRKMLTRPYVYNCADAQRVKNLSASRMVDDLENNRKTDVLLSKEALPQEQEFLEGWLDPQKRKAALVYNAIDKNGQPLMKPEIFPRPQFNTAFLQVFESIDRTIQAILGSYDAQLGINEKQLSGVAIVEAATQSNNAAMPYIVNFLEGLNQVAKVIVNLLPKYYRTLRTIPIMTPKGKHEYQIINDTKAQNPVNFDFEKHDLEVNVKPGTNFEVQRNKAASTLIELSKSSQAFNAWLNSEGLPILIDNIEIRGREQIKQGIEQFLEKQKQMQMQAGQKPDPQQQLIQGQLEIEQKKLMLQAQKQQNDLQIQSEKLKQSQMKLISDIDKDRADMVLRYQQAKDDSEKEQAKIAIDLYDHQLNVLRTAIAHMED